MKISYGYEELIESIKEELKENTLWLHDTIQVLRSENPISSGTINEYRPILYWYYSSEQMLDVLKMDLLNDEDEDFSFMDRSNLAIQYEKDKPFLENISVAECLEEMEEWNSII